MDTTIEAYSGDKISMSVTDLLSFSSCGYQYYINKILRLSPGTRSVDLNFGSVIHKCIEYIIECLHFERPCDFEDYYSQIWEKKIAKADVIYPMHWDEASLKLTGLHLLRQFKGMWPDIGLIPLTDANNNPMQELLMEANMGEGVILRGKLDLMAFDVAANLCVIDHKTPKTSMENKSFLSLSDQLTGYQTLVDYNSDRLGTQPVDKLGYLELLKKKVPTTGRGVGPTVNKPKLVPRRSKEVLDHFRDRVLWAAEDIRKGRFRKNALMAHNTPCAMCDYANFCTTGDSEGLSERPQRRNYYIAA